MESNVIQTKDLYLGALLYSGGVPLETFERGGGFTVFVFKNTEEANKLVRAYLAGAAQVNLRAFKNSFRDLRSLAHGDIAAPCRVR
ncbi:MAG: hypothetical protein JRE23_07100 [Deltaproteobacteria bacterium]|nr:hypothetical protein [Deltaproteobacteria bacterium]